MARYQVVIEEIVRYVVAVDADDAGEAGDAALEEFVNAESIDPYFDSVSAREVVVAVKVDDQGLPVGEEG